MNLLSINSINPNPQLSTALATYFARLALPVWQKKHPEDLRPEKAIEAAEKALFATDAYAAAYAAANAAAHAATDAAAHTATHADAHAAAYAAAAAAYAAANAAAHAAYADAHAAYAAANAAAAAHAADALGENKKSFIHHHLTQLLPLILWHKLNSKQSFGETEEIFELLPERCKEDFLFNLEALR